MDIASICLNAVKRASREYLKWTGGELGLSQAPEGFLRAEIARALAKRFKYVTMEQKARDVIEYAGARLRGKLPRNSGGRIDVITWWKKDEPRHLIEVKKVWSRAGFAADAKRLRLLLTRGGSMREGLIVAYTSAQKHGTCSKLWQALQNHSGAKIVRELPEREVDEVDGKWLWSAAVFRAGYRGAPSSTLNRRRAKSVRAG